MLKYCYGIVEDRNDPLKIGRVRVRIHFHHTDDKNKIASPDLPWSHVITPTTNAGLGGFGIQHSLVEGTTVFGFFRDLEMQDFVVMGVHQGISQNFYRETSTNEGLYRSVDLGFNDPRRRNALAYDGTADGVNPPGNPRPNALSSSLDTAPQLLLDAGITYDGSGSVRTESTDVEKSIPYYPLFDKVNSTDINVFATADADYSSRDLSELITDKKTNISYLKPAANPEKDSPTREDKEVTGAKSNATPLYPYNKALYTESGHIVELDDTRGNERISIEHRTGTFYEIDAEGNQIHRVVNDNYTVICKDNELYVGGKVNIKVLGDVDLTVVDGNVTSTLEKGNLKADIQTGTTDVTSEGKITITGNNTTEIISDTTVTGTLTVSGATALKSTLDVTGKQTNASSITASGEVKGKGVELSTHKHKTTIAGGSSSGTYSSVKPS